MNELPPTEESKYDAHPNSGEKGASTSETRSTETADSEDEAPPLEEHAKCYFDKQGHFIFQSGILIEKRYKTISFIGQGTFGTVLNVWDEEDNDYKALKIIRRGQRYNYTSRHELSYYEELQRRAGQDRFHPRVFGSFSWHGTLCIVFELLGPDLNKVIAKKGPLLLSYVKEVAYHLFSSLRFIHDYLLIHADVKPENIVFVDPDWTKEAGLPSPQICLVDYGGSIFEFESHPPTITTRPYRAPEVYMQLDWTYGVDIWSAGCVLVEALSRAQLFKTKDDVERMALFYKVLGAPPIDMVFDAQYAGCPYFEQGRLKWPEDCSLPSTILNVTSKKGLDEFLRQIEHEEAVELGLNEQATSRAQCRCRLSEECRSAITEVRSSSQSVENRPAEQNVAATLPASSGDELKPASKPSSKRRRLGEPTQKRWNECEKAQQRKDNDIQTGLGCSDCKSYHQRQWQLFRELIHSILQWRPEERFTAAQVLEHPLFEDLFRDGWAPRQSKSENDSLKVAWSWATARSIPLEDDEEQELRRNIAR